MKNNGDSENKFDCPIDWSKGKKGTSGKKGTKGKQMIENEEQMESEGKNSKQA